METLTTVLMFVPFVFILWLVNLAYRKQVEGKAEPARALKWSSYGLVIALYGVILFLGLLLQVIGILATTIDPGVFSAGPGMTLDRLPLFAASLWIPALAGLLLLTSPVRRLPAPHFP